MRRANYYPRHIGAVTYDFYIRRMPELQEQFPEVFKKDFPTPLAIGIHKQLKERTEFSNKEIAALLNVWTNRWEYIAMACSVRERIDLDGKLYLIEEGQKDGFVSHFLQLKPECVSAFAKRFLRAFKRPAFLNVPIKTREAHEVLYGVE